MVQYLFTDNSGNVLSVLTDGVNLSTENFTIQQVNGLAGITGVTTALQKLIGKTLDIGNATTKSNFVANAVTWGMALLARVVGSHDSNESYTNIGTTQLATVTNFAGATGSGAAGSDVLTWSAVANANNYVIDRATNVGFTTGVTLAVYSGPLLTFSDSGLTPATQYFYRIKAQGTNYVDSATAATSATTHA